MDVTRPYEIIGFGAMDVTNTYEFIGFGASRPVGAYPSPPIAPCTGPCVPLPADRPPGPNDHGPKAYEFIGFGGIHGPRPYKFVGFGDIHGPRPYKFIGMWRCSKKGRQVPCEPGPAGPGGGAGGRGEGPYSEN